MLVLGLLAFTWVVVATAEVAGGSCTPSAEYQRGIPQKVDFSVGERHRSVLLYIPLSLPTAGPRAPATLAFHGFHSNPWYFGRLIDITAYAERYGHIVALPFGTSLTFHSELCCPMGCDEACCSKGDQLDMWRPCVWNVGGTFSKLPRVSNWDDVGMAREAVDLLVKTACVDRARVSALGFSMGGMMMHRLACEASDVFNGVAAISGSMTLEPADCNPSKPAAWIQFCGTADKGCMSSVNSTFKLFGAQRGCKSTPEPSYVSATTHCEVLRGCTGGTLVERCLLADLGDEVPGHQRKVPMFVPQPATNLDAIKYILDRFSTQAVAPTAGLLADQPNVDQPVAPPREPAAWLQV